MSDEPAAGEEPGPYTSEECGGKRRRGEFAAAAKAGGQPRRMRLKLVAPIIAVGRQNGIRGQEGRLDRAQDSFATLRIGKPGRVTYQQRSFRHVAASPLPLVQPIGMPLKRAGSACRQIPPLLQKRAEVPRMAAEMGPVHPSQADIEKPSLPEEPSVAFQIPAEKQRRRIGGKATEALLVGAHGEFSCLGNNGLLSADSCSEQARSG